MTFLQLTLFRIFLRRKLENTFSGSLESRGFSESSSGIMFFNLFCWTSLLVKIATSKQILHLILSILRAFSQMLRLLAEVKDFPLQFFVKKSFKESLKSLIVLLLSLINLVLLFHNVQLEVDNLRQTFKYNNYPNSSSFFGLVLLELKI